MIEASTSCIIVWYWLFYWEDTEENKFLHIKTNFQTQLKFFTKLEVKLVKSTRVIRSSHKLVIKYDSFI